VRRLSSGWIGVAALTLGVLLGGCGAAPATAGGPGAGAATSTPLPTATAGPPAAPSLASLELTGCPPVALGSVAPQYSAVGSLKVSIPHRWASLDYPEELMPSNAPGVPYQVQLTAGAFQPNPPVNPSLATGYALQFCNQTGVPHTISGLSVSIASFTPNSGLVNVWHICQDGPYDAATKQTTGGCGGGLGEVDFLAATLPDDSTGATAPATDNPQFGGVNLPVVIGPNQYIVLLVAVKGLTSQGMYTLNFGVSVDGAAPATLAPSDGAFLIAPSARVWTGTACQTPAMQARIPASSQDTYYVCPPAA
jgi:hypothetical protein